VHGVGGTGVGGAGVAGAGVGAGVQTAPQTSVAPLGSGHVNVFALRSQHCVGKWLLQFENLDLNWKPASNPVSRLLYSHSVCSDFWFSAGTVPVSKLPPTARKLRLESCLSVDGSEP